MKSFLIIGMGKFGHHLCESLLQLGNEIMIVDQEEDRVSDMISRVENVQIGDCTNIDMVKSLGVSNFDIVFVCIGSNFQNSLEVTWLMHQEGAKHVVSKANRDTHARFLLRNGADEVIYPDRDIADRMAKAYSADSIFDYFEIEDGYSMYEIKMPEKWIGKTLRQLNVRQKHKINIVALKSADQKINVLPDADYPFRRDDRVLVVGDDHDVEKLLHIHGAIGQEDKFWKQGRKQV